MNAESINIAVFGDTHGHLRLMFQLCRLWQLDHGMHLDGILQCGDLGFFPEVTRLDKATKSYAKRDPEELGFAEYFSKSGQTETDPLLEKILKGDPDDLETVRAAVGFCHGNHEDFELLKQATGSENMVTVDRYDCLSYLPSGETTEIAGLSVAALGGAPESVGDADAPLLSRSVSGMAARRLTRQRFNVLLCHGAPKGIGGESDQWGSALIRNVIERVQPAYCFFGHHRQPIEPATIGQTKCYWHNDVNFERDRNRRYTGPPEPRCMGILSWTAGHHDFQYVDEPWFRDLTGSNWRHW